MATTREITGVTADGEIVKAMHYSSKYKKTPTEEFIIIYLQEVIDLMTLLQHAEIKLLYCLWKDCSFSTEKGEGNIIHTNSYYKTGWAQSINVQITTINTSLSKLEKKGFIKRLGTSVYVLNPEYFYKGDRNSRFLAKENLRPLFKPTEEPTDLSKSKFNYTKQEE